MCLLYTSASDCYVTFLCITCYLAHYQSLPGQARHRHWEFFTKHHTPRCVGNNIKFFLSEWWRGLEPGKFLTSYRSPIYCLCKLNVIAIIRFFIIVFSRNFPSARSRILVDNYNQYHGFWGLKSSTLIFYQIFALVVLVGFGYPGPGPG